jgi:hypothetical protein
MSIWGGSGTFEQFKFGERKTIVKGGKKLADKWEHRRREDVRLFKQRRATDAFKRIIFRDNPYVTMFSIYGNVLINGQNRRFSFDVCFTGRPSPANDLHIYNTMKQLHDKLLSGYLPRRFYYSFHFGDNVLHSPMIEHEGIVEISQTIVSPKTKHKTESWVPGGKKKLIKRQISQKVREARRYQIVRRQMRL